MLPATNDTPATAVSTDGPAANQANDAAPAARKRSRDEARADVIAILRTPEGWAKDRADVMKEAGCSATMYQECLNAVLAAPDECKPGHPHHQPSGAEGILAHVEALHELVDGDVIERQELVARLGMIDARLAMRRALMRRWLKVSRPDPEADANSAGRGAEVGMLLKCFEEAAD